MMGGTKLRGVCNAELTREQRGKVGVQSHAVQGDPFSGDSDERAWVPEAAPVRITTRFVEVGPGVEELKFDWVVGPKRLEGEN